MSSLLFSLKIIGVIVLETVTHPFSKSTLRIKDGDIVVIREETVWNVPEDSSFSTGEQPAAAQVLHEGHYQEYAGGAGRGL